MNCLWLLTLFGVSVFCFIVICIVLKLVWKSKWHNLRVMETLLPPILQHLSSTPIITLVVIIAIYLMDKNNLSHSVK